MALEELFDYARRVFSRQRRSYQMSLGSPVGASALVDLARFCYAHESVWHPDPNIRIMLEGRREVWLHIQKNLQLNDQQIWDLYKQSLDTQE